MPHIQTQFIWIHCYSTRFFFGGGGLSVALTTAFGASGNLLFAFSLWPSRLKGYVIRSLRRGVNVIFFPLGCYRSVVVTDVSGQPVGPIFSEDLYVSPETSVTTYHCCVTFQKSEDRIKSRLWVVCTLASSFFLCRGCEVLLHTS